MWVILQRCFSKILFPQVTYCNLFSSRPPKIPEADLETHSGLDGLSTKAARPGWVHVYVHISIFFIFSNICVGTCAAGEFSKHDFMLWTVNSPVANTVSMLAHTLVENMCYLPNCSHSIFCVYLNLCRFFFFKRRKRGTTEHTHPPKICLVRRSDSILWEQASVSWACADGERSGVFDEEMVSNITGTPVHQIKHFKEPTKAAEIVSKTRPSPSGQCLLSNTQSPY